MSLDFFFFNFLFIYDRHTVREREAETQAEGEAGSMHREPDVGFDPGSPGSRPGPKAGAKPLRHPGIPQNPILIKEKLFCVSRVPHRPGAEASLRSSQAGLAGGRTTRGADRSIWIDVKTGKCKSDTLEA